MTFLNQIRELTLHSVVRSTLTEFEEVKQTIYDAACKGAIGCEFAYELSQPTLDFLLSEGFTVQVYLNSNNTVTRVIWWS